MKLGFVNEILRGVWLLDKSVEAHYANLAIKHLESLAVADRTAAAGTGLENRVDKNTIVAINALSGEMYSIASEIPEEPFIGIVPIEGVVRKNSYCGEMGTLDMQAMMRANENDPNCMGHILRIDSPGGSAANTETFARFIRYDVQKPVVAWVGSMCASAAYYIACAADEIYVSQKDDSVGSIGVYCTLRDWNAYYAKEGLVTHEIYSKHSPKKNDFFTKAMEGDYEPIQDEYLDPVAEQFMATVKEMRPNLTDKSAYEGKLYAAMNAPEGMIDGIMTWEKAVARVSAMTSTATV